MFSAFNKMNLKREMMNNKIYVHVSKKGNLLGFFTTKEASNDMLKQNSGVTVEVFEKVETSEKPALNIGNVSECACVNNVEVFQCEKGIDYCCACEKKTHDR